MVSRVNPLQIDSSFLLIFNKLCDLTCRFIIRNNILNDYFHFFRIFQHLGRSTLGGRRRRDGDSKPCRADIPFYPRSQSSKNSLEIIYLPFRQGIFRLSGVCGIRNRFLLTHFHNMGRLWALDTRQGIKLWGIWRPSHVNTTWGQLIGWADQVSCLTFDGKKDG